MSKEPRQLKRLRVKRVDLVDKGAAYDELSGEGAHVVLFKRDGKETLMPVEDDDVLAELADVIEKGRRKKGKGMAPSAGGTNCPSCGKAAGANSAYCPNCGKNLGTQAGPPAASGNTTKGVGMSKKEALKLTQKALKKIQKKAREKEILKAAEEAGKPKDPAEKVTKRTITRKAADGKVETVEETVTKADVPETEDIYKGLSPAVAERLQKAEKRAQSAEEKVSKLVEEQAKSAFKKVAAGFGLPGANADELGEILRKSAETLDQGQYDKLVQVLKSAGEIVKTSAVFTEIGGTGGSGAPGSAAEELEKRAKALIDEHVKKGLKEELTIADAMSKVFEADPALYAKYRREVSVGASRDRSEA